MPNTHIQRYVLETKRLLTSFCSVALMFSKVKENEYPSSEPSTQNPVSQGVSCSILTAVLFCFVLVYQDSPKEPFTCSSHLLCIQLLSYFLDIGLFVRFTSFCTMNCLGLTLFNRISYREIQEYNKNVCICLTCSAIYQKRVAENDLLTSCNEEK